MGHLMGKQVEEVIAGRLAVEGEEETVRASSKVSTSGGGRREGGKKRDWFEPGEERAPPAPPTRA